MLKIKTKIIFLSVLIFTALCAAFIAFSIPSLTASAATTPIYSLTYDYKYYQRYISGSTRGEKTGVSTNYKDIIINFWGDSHTSDTKTLSSSDNYFSFSTVNISVTRIKNYTSTSELYLYNSSNSEIANDKHNGYTIQKFPTLNISKSLSQGTYTIKGKFHNNSSGGTGWTSWIEISTNFIIDTSAPTISISCGDNGFSKDNVTVSYSDNYAVASAVYSRSTNGSYPTSATTSFNSGTSFSEEGNYTVKVTDKAGNVTTKYFTIDKTAPTLTLSGVSNGGFTNGSVSASWSSIYSYVTSNKSNSNDVLTVKYSYNTSGSFPTTASTTYTSGTSLTTAGNYLMIISDKAGNSTSYTFTIDKSAPKIALVGVYNGFTNGGVKATWGTTFDSITAQRSNSNDALTVKYSYNTSGSFPTSASTTYNSNTLTTAGNYLMTISDKAGNSTSYTFTIDKTAPTLTLSGVSNGGFTNGSVKASWSSSYSSVTSNKSNSNDVLTVKYSYNTSGSFPTTASTTYTSGTSLTTAGNYLMTISDSAGNSKSYTFTIDKTAPTLTLSGVSNGGFTNGSVSASWETISDSITAQCSNNNDVLTVKYSYNTNADFPTSAATVYSLNTPLAEAGNYRMTISDSAGNSTSYTFTIDKSAPVLSIVTTDNGFFVDNRTKSNVTATWGTAANGVTAQRANSNDALTVTYGFNETGNFPVTAITSFSSGTVFNTEGKYLLQITDKAGNSSLYKFEIYRQPPKFTILSESGAELSSEYNAFNINIKLAFSNNVTARLNSKNYNSGELIIEEGEYSIILTDELGNRSTETVYIIKTLPTANFDVLKTSINRWYETTDSSGTTLAFASYDNAYSTADERERASITTGTWNLTTWDGGINIAPEDLSIAKQGMSYYVYKSFNSASTLNAYFSLATLNTSIEKYATSSVVTKFTPSTPATAANNEIIYRDVYFSRSAITFNTIKNCSIFVDGVKKEYPYTLTNAGQHTIMEIDIAGNSVTYSVNIDAAQPIVRVTNLNGNIPQALSFGNTYYFTYGIRISLDDADEQAILKINDDYYLGETRELRSAGIYTISARDAAGNSGNLTIYISLDEPTITITEKEVAGIINSFDVAINKNYSLNNITSLSILKFNDTEGEWEQLSSDNSSLPVLINNKTLFYSFDITGQYRIIIIDVFGRFIEEQYNFIKGSPKGTLANTTNQELQNGAYVKSSVYFTWATALDCSAEISKNGAPAINYEKGTFISEEGEYSIKLYSNVDDVYNIYTFTIDKTAPVGTLTANGEPLKSGATTRFAVIFEWEEAGCSATFSRANSDAQPYAAGTEITEEGNYTITISDKAGNKRSYSFRIKTTAPTATIMAGTNKLKNYGVTKSDVYITWNESNCTCLLNGANYISNTKIKVEGKYSIILTDAYGNSNNYFFTIDKTAPVGTLFVDDKQITETAVQTNKTVSLKWEEADCTAVINKNFAYISGTTIKADGDYEIVLTDPAGNISTYNFTIKTTPPNVKLFANNIEVESGSATRYTVRLTWLESGCTATLNGQPYSSGTTINVEGEYEFIVFDKYGNQGTWIITIDKTPPVLSVISNGQALENGEITRYNVYTVWDDVSATATLNGNPVNNGACIEDEGEYTLIVTDYVGNKSTQVFIIDKTAKAGLIISNTNIIESGSITRFNTYFTWSSKGCTATINGISYSKGQLIKDDGDYEIILTDNAGNINVYSFTIDKTAPVGILYIYQNDTFSELGELSATAGNLVFKWEEADCTATVNGEPYSSGTEINTEGEYVFVLVDKAGNSSTYKGIIDKTPPEILAFNTNQESMSDGDITRHNIYFTWNERSCIATLNGEAYTKETVIKETGDYTLILTDSVGNSSVITISVFKLIPTADIIPIGEGFSLPYLNNGFKVEWEEENCTATLNGAEYIKGTEITEEGTYQFVIINRVGTTTSYDITIDRTAPDAKIFNVDNSTEEIKVNYAVSNIYFTWEEQGCTATLNGEPYQKKTYITKDGGYSFTLTDKAGNTNTYNITVLKAKPEIIFISEESQNELKNNSSTTDNVLIVKLDDEDIITLNGEVFNTDNPIKEVGKYTFTVTNVYGNSAEFSITIKELSDEKANTGALSFFQGSTTGTIIFFSVLSILAVGLIVVPLIKNKVKGGSFKRKLK